MQKIILAPLAAALCLALLAGCAHEPGLRIEPADTLASAPGPARPALEPYGRLLVDPVDLTMAEDGRWQGVDEARRAELGHLTQESFEQAAGARLALTDHTGAGVLRLHLTVEDLKLARPLGATVTHLLPIGLVLNAGRSLSGASAPGSMGSVTISGQLRDAQSNALLATFHTRMGPDPMNLGAALSQDAAMKAAVERTAKHFAIALSKLQEGSSACQDRAETVCIVPDTPEKGEPSDAG